MDENRIEKSVERKAPRSRLWKALTDPREFGRWFGCKLETPFQEGKTARGKITYPGFEHLQWAVDVKTMNPERLFAFTWHPYAVDPEVDHSKETPTLVEFRPEATPAGGTVLTVTESGFEKIPANRRLEAFRMDEEGWIEQLENIAKHVG